MIDPFFYPLVEINATFIDTNSAFGLILYLRRLEKMGGINSTRLFFIVSVVDYFGTEVHIARIGGLLSNTPISKLKTIFTCESTTSL